MNDKTPPPIPTPEPQDPVNFDEIKEPTPDGADAKKEEVEAMQEAAADVTKAGRKEVAWKIGYICSLGTLWVGRKLLSRGTREPASDTSNTAADTPTTKAPPEKFKTEGTGPANQFADILRQRFPQISAKASGAEGGIQQTEVTAGQSSVLVIFSETDNTFCITEAKGAVAQKLRKIAEDSMPGYRYVFASQMEEQIARSTTAVIAMEDPDYKPDDNRVVTITGENTDDFTMHDVPIEADAGARQFKTRLKSALQEGGETDLVVKLGSHKKVDPKTKKSVVVLNADGGKEAQIIFEVKDGVVVHSLAGVKEGVKPIIEKLIAEDL